MMMEIKTMRSMLEKMGGRDTLHLNDKDNSKNFIQKRKITDVRSKKKNVPQSVEARGSFFTPLCVFDVIRRY